MIRTCVIYNPAAGRGRARDWFAATEREFGALAEFRPTTAPGCGVTLAEAACREGFARVIAAGGDGTVHEVANGVLRSGRRDVVFGVLPVGSMNDYAFALEHFPVATAVDVGVVRAAGRERFFVNGLGVGFNGMVTLESTKIRRLRGMPLYALAFLNAMVKHFHKPVMTVRFDDVVLRTATLAVSVSLGQREGGFPIFPAARLDDGIFDTLHAAGVRRWELVRYLPAMILGQLPANHPQLRLGTCRSAMVSADVDLCIHTDGEFFSLPGDGVRSIEIELLPRRLLVEQFKMRS